MALDGLDFEIQNSLSLNWRTLSQSISHNFSKQLAGLEALWRQVGEGIQDSDSQVFQKWQGMGIQLANCRTETDLGVLCRDLMDLAHGIGTDETLQPLAIATLNWVQEHGSEAFQAQADRALRVVTGVTSGLAEGAEFLARSFGAHPVREELLVGMGSAMVAKSVFRLVGANLARGWGLGSFGSAVTTMAVGTGGELLAFSGSSVGYQAAMGHEVSLAEFGNQLGSGAGLLIPMGAIGGLSKWVKGAGIAASSVRAGLHVAGAAAGTAGSAWAQGQSLTGAQIALGTIQLMTEGRVHGSLLGLSPSLAALRTRMELHTIATLQGAARNGFNAARQLLRPTGSRQPLGPQFQVAAANGSLPAHALGWNNSQTVFAKGAGPLGLGAVIAMMAPPEGGVPQPGRGLTGKTTRRGRRKAARNPEIEGSRFQFLANTFTAANLACGLLSIGASLYLNDPSLAAYLSVFGNVPDMFDGMASRRWRGPSINNAEDLARATEGMEPRKVESLKRKILRRRLGGLYDSTADGISFGVAPAVAEIMAFGGEHAPWYVAASALFYSGMALWRLTKYDAYDANPWLKPENTRENTFNGLASPGAALLAGGLIIATSEGVFQQMGVPTDMVAPMVASGMVGLSLLMNTNRVQYPHFGKRVLGPLVRTGLGLARNAIAVTGLVRRKAISAYDWARTRELRVPLVLTAAGLGFGMKTSGIDFAMLGAGLAYVGYGPYETLKHRWSTRRSSQNGSEPT